ncbi:uncharacterized protein ACRADG_004054 [Cochliomyia hominivorax]
MDQQQQMPQAEKMIIEMLEFLDSSSEEETCDFEKPTTEQNPLVWDVSEKDLNDNLIVEKPKIKIKNLVKKKEKTISKLAEELKKLNQQFSIWTTKEEASTKNTENLLPDNANLDWKNKLETNCRRNLSNIYSQEVHKAIYQDTTGHPSTGSAEYFQAVQNYALYGKHFLDFPDNTQTILNDKNTQNAAVPEGTNLMTTFGHYIYPKFNNSSIPSVLAANPNGIQTSSAATAATYYQLCNSIQAQARPTISNSTANTTAYGIFLGNKVSYVAATPTTPSIIYNQHGSTTTNFISNSLANAALATSPTILYTNPILTSTTQQYLNAFVKETQFLSAALASSSNSTPSAAVTSSTNSAGLYERLIYAQMLQQQLYQTQQTAVVAAMFQQKQRAAVAASVRQSNVNVVTNSNRTSPQHLNIVSPTTTSSCSGTNLGSCTRQVRNNNSPTELLRLKPQTTTLMAAAGVEENLKTSSE